MAAYLSIILVEDHDDLRELTADALRAEGHRVTALSCAEELEDKAGGTAADMFLIDLNLPGEDGFSLARRIRQAQPSVGICIISARSQVEDRVDSYNRGADWYLPKPVAFTELRAIINSFAQRKQVQQVQVRPLEGVLRLQQRALTGPADQVRLTSSEETLLTALARAPQGKLETWQLSELFGMDIADVSKTSLEVRITRLRKKLIQVGAAEHCLESIRSVGYQLNVPVQILSA